MSKEKNEEINNNNIGSIYNRSNGNNIVFDFWKEYTNINEKIGSIWMKYVIMKKKKTMIMILEYKIIK